MSATVTLEIPSDPRMLRALRGVCRSLAEQAGLSEVEVGRVVLGLEEACTNVIRHAYGGEADRPIRFLFRLEPNVLIIEMVDWGRKATREQMHGRELADVRPGGLGIHLMNRTFDAMDYDFEERDHNRLVLRKRLPAPVDDAPEG